MTADAEFISIVQEVFKRLGIDVIIKINNRKILNGILASSGIKENLMEPIILSIDKLEKFGIETVKRELKVKGLKTEAINKILEYIAVEGSNGVKLTKLEKVLTNKEGVEGLNEIKQLFTFLTNKDNVVFDPSLARGLAYYTGTVFEVFLVSNEIKSAVAGGGRYDKMIQQFLGSNQQFPAVGISFGLDVITDALNTEVKQKTVARLFIIPIGNLKEAMKISKEFRDNGIKTDVDLIGRGISKNLEYADAMSIPYVIFIGERELQANKVKLRDMKSGKEELIAIEEAIKRLSKD